jgi:formylglycine-generating enzyme required for sulfatase activity
MTLTGAQLGRIHEVLLAAYSRDELLRLVRVRMDGVDFTHHVTAEKAFADQVFEFIEWANRQERALELLRCAAEGNARNAGLQTLWTEAQGWDAPPPPSKTEPSVTPAAPHYVFLAYSRKDEAIMRQLRADLLAAGIVAWIDQEDLEPGTPVWQRAIEAAIRSAKCVVVILSPDAKESEWVNIEMTFARRIQRRIYPVLARGNEDSAVPFLLEATHRIDISSSYTEGVQNRLIPALRKHLGMTEAVQQAKSGDAVTPPAKANPAKPTQPIAAPKPAIVKLPIDIEWVTIPAGEFLMGSDKTKDKQARDDETPQHRLHLPEYRIAKYTITNAQYQVFVNATGYQAPKHWASGVIPKGKENHPVTNVSWEDAQAFCKWAGVRLPSEAEWEKAARGADGRIWPWGNKPPTQGQCNFGMNVGDTTPVGKYPKGVSCYGSRDMVGNVWEWTGSLHKPYPYQSDDGRENPEADGRRAARGGAWGSHVDSVRCAYRNWVYPWIRLHEVGFRVVSPGC